MKRICFIFFLFAVFCAESLFSLDINLFVAPKISLHNSRSKESLYFSGNFNSDSSKKCSLLEWNEKNVVKLGIESEFDLKIKNFETVGLIYFVDFSLPRNNGKMTDSDWNVDGVKFNYSIFNASIECNEFSDIFKNFNTSIEFFYKKQLIDFFTIKPCIKFLYSSVFFNSEDGHGWYGASNWTTDGKEHAWNDKESHYFPDGKYKLANIDYQVQQFGFFSGLSAIFKISKSADIFTGFDFSPYTFILATDRHHPNNYVTKDYIHIVFGNCDFYAGFDINFSKWLTFNFFVNYSNIKHTKGSEYFVYDKNDINELSSQKAGYSCSEFNFSASLKFLIF